MTYRLHNRDGSGGFAVEAALAMAGAPFELIPLESRSGTPLPEDFRRINPWKQIPVLILPDGATMTESAAILIHLAACHPGTGLGPEPGTPAHARFLRWMVFASVNVYESALRRIYPERYTADPACAGAVRTAAVQRMGDGLLALEAAVDPGPFLVGDTLGVLEVYVSMLRVWFREPLDTPRLAAIADRVRRHPVVGPLWRRHYGDR